MRPEAALGIEFSDARRDLGPARCVQRERFGGSLGNRTARGRRVAVKRDPETGETVGHKPASPSRLLIARAFTIVEDVVYIVLGVLLAGTALALLVTGAAGFGRSVLAGAPPQAFVGVLDQILLVLLVIELLYTVKVSFREHSLVPEPFLIVGLIAVTRRILVITAELSALLEKGDETVFRHAMLELGLLTAMVVGFVGSLWMLRKRSATPVAQA
jgi:uncharacterized membrane protein (DUF373 family)